MSNGLRKAGRIASGWARRFGSQRPRDARCNGAQVVLSSDYRAVSFPMPRNHQRPRSSASHSGSRDGRISSVCALAPSSLPDSHSIIIIQSGISHVTTLLIHMPVTPPHSSSFLRKRDELRICFVLLRCFLCAFCVFVSFCYFLCFALVLYSLCFLYLFCWLLISSCVSVETRRISGELWGIAP